MTDDTRRVVQVKGSFIVCPDCDDVDQLWVGVISCSRCRKPVLAISCPVCKQLIIQIETLDDFTGMLEAGAREAGLPNAAGRREHLH